MKTRILIVLVLMIMALVAVGTAPALAKSPRKITGGVQFGPVFSLQKGWLRFDVQESDADTHSATGQVRWKEYNKDDGWRHVTANATCVTFGEDEQTALVAVQIVSRTGWGLGDPGQWMVFWVHDGGTPGSEGDEFASPLFPPADEYPGCEYFVPDFKVPVVGGDLMIHH
jgi:hypothetical protein